MSFFDTTDPADLLWGSSDSIANYLGVSKKTVLRYKAAPDRMPTYAVRLLKLRYGDLTGLLDDSWAGFTFRQGELFTPGFKYGFSADEVKGWFFGRQELHDLRLENGRLKQEVKKLRAQVWAINKVQILVSGTLRGGVRSGRQGW